MKFIYKINASYDGFTPSQIPARLLPGKRLKLGWRRYLDEVEPRQEVWVYFKGRGVEPGVYARGRVVEVDSHNAEVLLRVDRYSTDELLVEAEAAPSLASLVQPPGRQVFVLPETIDLTGTCTLATTAASCVAKRCGKCSVWHGLPSIADEDCNWPMYLDTGIETFSPAYWVIPSRCYIAPRLIREDVQQTSEVFYRFKLGDDAVVHPLALGMASVLEEQTFGRFDALVPIPLSPDKKSAKEIDRAGLLAKALAPLLGTKVVPALTLSKSISKRRYLLDGGTRSGFEFTYHRALEVNPSIAGAERVLLVDDVCTRGSTLSMAYQRIREVCPGEISAATAGQMIIKSVVADDSVLLAG